MKKPRTIRWQGLARNTRGSEIAETAMILPLFFMIFMAIFWFGQAYRAYGALTHATRLGAEAAVAPVCTTCAAPPANAVATNAQTAVQNALQYAHLSQNQLVPWSTWTPPTVCTCGTVASATACTAPRACDPSVTNVCVQENVQLSYPSPGGMGTCGISVSARFQYAYHFPIPFTNLDLGNILLPGQAQMRVETQ
jgi:Flp pilus assembly protein TadG